MSVCVSACGGNCENPDSVQFECEYRAVATGLMFSNSEKTNCEQDLDTLLLQFSTYASHESPQVIVDPESIMEGTWLLEWLQIVVSNYVECFVLKYIITNND